MPSLASYHLLARKHLTSRLTMLSAKAAAAGRYPFEDGWYTKEEIEAKKQAMRSRDRAIVVDLVLLFSGLGLFCALCFGVVLFLIG